VSESPILSADQISLAYGDGDQVTLAVNRVSLELPGTGFVGIMGPSGSGKSSLLYLLSGLKRVTEGAIQIDNSSYSGLDEKSMVRLRRERFGFVFQQPFLLSYLTARENVLSAAAADDREARSHANSLFEALGIGALADKFPHHLSGGERQRVCVARAMISRPDVIFADEPTASLDHANGHVVIDLLSSYRDRGLVIVVTHDPEMLSGADYVYQMRDGKLVDAPDAG
jgi:putative ABC transport system ATP-binding protein